MADRTTAVPVRASAHAANRHEFDPTVQRVCGGWSMTRTNGLAS